jgi:hypothetical protein
MKHLPDLKTLGVAAFAAMMLPAAAMAQIQTYYHAGAWDAFSGRNDKGGAVCGVGNTNPTDNRRVSIRFDIGATDTVIMASKPDWAVPDGRQVTVVMQIGLNTPWTQQGTGHGHGISWVLDRASMQAFDQQFRSASLMTLTFPDGNEQPWAVPLTGSSAIDATFARCISDLTSQVQAAKAAGVGAPPPAAPGATQPFGSSDSGAAPPADASSSADQPNGTPSGGSSQTGGAATDGTAQPGGTAQSDGTTPPGGTTQPDGATQPGGTQPTH